MKIKVKAILAVVICIALCFASAGVGYYVSDKKSKKATINLSADSVSPIYIRDKGIQIREYTSARLKDVSNNGYAVIMNNTTGEIIAFVSNSSDENSSESELNKPVKCSLYKLLYAIPIIESGYDEIIYDDNEGFYKLNTGEQICNYKQTSYGLTDMESAIANNSNVWFAKAIEKVEPDKIQDFNKRIMLGEQLNLGFTTVNSSFDSSINPVISVIAGEGISMEPVQICAILSGISNGTGIAMKPFYETDGDATSSKLMEFTDKNTASTLRDYLKNIGRRFGYSNLCMSVFKNYSSNGYTVYCGNEEYTILCSADCNNSMHAENAAFDMMLHVMYT